MSYVQEIDVLLYFAKKRLTKIVQFANVVYIH